RAVFLDLQHGGSEVKFIARAYTDEPLAVRFPHRYGDDGFSHADLRFEILAEAQPTGIERVVTDLGAGSIQVRHLAVQEDRAGGVFVMGHFIGVLLWNKSMIHCAYFS